MLKLKEAREKAGLTQKEIAVSLGVSVQSVSNWEIGIREPSLDVVSKICDLCNVSADNLLGRVPFTVKTGTPPEKLSDGAHKAEVTLPADAAPDRQREALQSLVREIVRQELSRRPR